LHLLLHCHLLLILHLLLLLLQLLRLLLRLLLLRRLRLLLLLRLQPRRCHGGGLVQRIELLLQLLLLRLAERGRGRQRARRRRRLRRLRLTRRPARGRPGPAGARLRQARQGRPACDGRAGGVRPAGYARMVACLGGLLFKAQDDVRRLRGQPDSGLLLRLRAHPPRLAQGFATGLGLDQRT